MGTPVNICYVGYKKQGHLKRDEARLPLLFLNNNDHVFKVPDPKKIIGWTDKLE